MQEVKVPGGIDLSYADNLTADYRKLFDDDPRFTLNTRIQGLAFKLEVGDKRVDLANRLRSLATTEAETSTQVKLLPTIVHEKVGADPVTKLLAIKTAISALGWSASQIRPRSIAFQDLIPRLTRMARGQP